MTTTCFTHLCTVFEIPTKGMSSTSAREIAILGEGTGLMVDVGNIALRDTYGSLHPASIDHLLQFDGSEVSTQSLGPRSCVRRLGALGARQRTTWYTPRRSMLADAR